VSTKTGEGQIGRGRMIDNPEQAERLLARLQAALPLPARVTPELAATLQTKNTKATYRRPARSLGSATLETKVDCLPPRLHPRNRNGSLRLDYPSALQPPPAAGARHRRLPEAPRQTPAAPGVIKEDRLPTRERNRQRESPPASPLRLRITRDSSRSNKLCAHPAPRVGN
jgi:hypothetical protein